MSAYDPMPTSPVRASTPLSVTKFSQPSVCQPFPRLQVLGNIKWQQTSYQIISIGSFSFESAMA